MFFLFSSTGVMVRILQPNTEYHLLIEAVGREASAYTELSFSTPRGYAVSGEVQLEEFDDVQRFLRENESTKKLFRFEKAMSTQIPQPTLMLSPVLTNRPSVSISPTTEHVFNQADDMSVQRDRDHSMVVPEINTNLEMLDGASFLSINEPPTVRSSERHNVNAPVAATDGFLNRRSRPARESERSAALLSEEALPRATSLRHESGGRRVADVSSQERK